MERLRVDDVELTDADRGGGILDQGVPARDGRERAREGARSLARLDPAAHAATKRRVPEETLTRLRAPIEADVEEWRATDSEADGE